MIPTIPSIHSSTAQGTQPVPHANNNILLTTLNAVLAPMIPNINSSSNFTSRPFNTNVSTTFVNNNLPKLPNLPTLPNLPIIAPLIPQAHVQQAEQQSFKQGQQELWQSVQLAQQPQFPQQAQPHMRIVRDNVLQQPMIPQYSEAITKTVDNANKRWSKEEEAQVMSWVASGVALSEIGNRLGRSGRAIKMRVILLLSTRFQNERVFNGQRPAEGSVEEICQRHQVTYGEVLEYNSTTANTGRTSRFPGNNNTSSGLDIPTPGTLPILVPLGTRVDAGVLTLQPGQSTMQGSAQGSTLVNNNILTEIRDLLVQLNIKVDKLNNTSTISAITVPQ